MNFSIIIPQVFYDLIARVFPGFLFLVLVLLSVPESAEYLSPLGLTGKGNFVDSLGQGVVYAVLCYFLGWLFLALTWRSRRDEIRRKYQKRKDSKSLNSKYQWIRLAHPPAGFRIVKLRAEARMFETARTAMIGVVVIAVVYVVAVLVFVGPPCWPVNRAFWIRPLMGVLIATVSFCGFRKPEVKAWHSYCANICSVYDILHDADDPIKPFPADLTMPDKRAPPNDDPGA